MATRSLGSLTLDLIAKTIGFEQGMDRAARHADKRMKELERRAQAFGNVLGKGFASVATGIASFVGVTLSAQAAVQGFMQAVQAADRLDELSNKLQISTEQLSAWGYAAKLTGNDLETLQSSFDKLAKNMAAGLDPKSKQSGLFKALGVEIKDAQGNLRSIEQVLPEIADRFKTLDNATTEAALAQELFGRSGAQLLEFLNLGSDGLKEMEDRAQRLGIIISGETAAAAAEFNDRLDDLKAATQGWFTVLSAQLLPQLTELVNWATEFVIEGQKSADVANSIANGIREIGNAARLVSGTIEVLDRLRGVLAGLELQGRAAFQTLNPANWSGDGLRQLQGTYDRGTQLIENGWQAMQKAEERGAQLFSGVRSRVLSGQRQSGGNNQLEQAINRMLSGSDSASGKGKSGKSEAQRQAEQLQRSYESLMESMRERIALFGQEGQAAKVRYDVEQGALKGLSDELKQAAIARAEQIDQMQRVADLQKAADDAVREHTRSVEEGRRRTQELIEDLQFEYDLMRMSNIEREKAIATRYADAHATAEQIKQLQDLAASNYELSESIRFQDGMRREFQDFFSEVLRGTSSVEDAFKSMLDGIGRMIANRIAQNWVDQLFGNMGQSGGGQFGGWLSSLSGLFGGGRANGGWTNANSIYEVNERGIEMATVRGRDYLLTGNSPVQITPNERLGMGGNRTTVVNMTLQGRVDRRTESQIAREVSIQQRVAARNN